MQRVKWKGREREIMGDVDSEYALSSEGKIEREWEKRVNKLEKQDRQCNNKSERWITKKVDWLLVVWDGLRQINNDHVILKDKSWCQSKKKKKSKRIFEREFEQSVWRKS